MFHGSNPIISWNKTYVSLQTNQKEKVNFNLHYCHSFVTPLPFSSDFTHASVRKANIFGYILEIQNISVLLNISSIFRSYDQKHISYQSYMDFTLVWREELYIPDFLSFECLLWIMHCHICMKVDLKLRFSPM